MKSVDLPERAFVKQGNVLGLCLTLLCLLALMSSIFFFASPVYAVPTIFPGSLPSGQVNVHYTATLTAAPLTCPCTWQVTSGSLPPGLNLAAATGVISGKPTAAGMYSFFVQVTDTTGPSPQQGFFISISETPLSFLTTSLEVAKENEPYSDVISVSGGTTPYKFSISSGTLPTGLDLGRTTGYISGTPAKGTAGTHSFIVSVTDSSATPLSGQQSFSLTVEKGGYEAIITIGSGLKAGETKVLANGSQIATLRGGQSTKLSLDLGAIRVISVEPIIQHPSESGIRFTAEADELTVSEASPDANFLYYTEYLIELKAEPSEVGQLSGSGWYKEGYTLRASAPDEVNDSNDPGTQYRFSQWALPTGETISNRDLSLNVSAPGSCIANYDTYYKLTLTSPYGEAEGSNWYKKGSQAEWSMTNPQIRIPGILGIFGGKLNAINSSGSTVMDGPKTIDIEWEPNYTMPLILIPLTIILLILGGYGLYLLLRSLQPKPAPYPPPYYPPYQATPPPPQAVPPPQTTVVMIGGDKAKLGPPTTREQLMEKFGELLQKYEEEIKSTTAAKELPEAKPVEEEKRLPAPEPTSPTVVEAEATAEEEGTTCSFTSKKPLRVVASSWRQADTRTVTLPSADEATTEGEAGLAVVWARDIYQEWEILKCWLPHGHKEPHEGSVEVVYSRLNTITEERIYQSGQEPKPPEPHYTNNMPRADVAADELVPSDKLPPETMS